MTSFLASRILAPAAATAALLGAGAPAALAQSTTSPSLSQAPPVSLGSAKKKSSHKAAPSSTAKKKNSSTAPARPTRLPNTGYNVWAVALLGGGLIAAGLGLRLRVRDVRWP